jgi:cell division protein FtsN
MGVRLRTTRAARGRSKGGFLLGVFTGLILGLVIAIGVAFYLSSTPIPFATKAKPSGPEAGTPPEKLPTIAGLPQRGTSSEAGQGSKAPEKPKFDFYKILPGSEEPVSDKELKERMRAGQPQPEGRKEVYYVQAGSFQNPADADNQKAKLAMLGFESSVEPANLPDKGTWYRVRLGPYTKLDEINQVRQTLAQNGVQASLVKLKDAGTGKGN